MPETPKSNEQKHRTPLWIKRAGAIIGIIATVVTVITGIWALVLQFKDITLDIERERTKQIQSAQVLEKIKVQRTNREAANTKYQAQIEKERRLQREAETKRTQSEVQKQKIEIRRDEAARLHNEAVKREQRVLKAISDLVDSNQPTLSALLILSEYAEPDGDYQDLIITAFVAKSEKTESIAEVRLIFKLFDRIGVNAFESVVQINRVAFRQFSHALLTLFWSQIQITFESVFKSPQKNKHEETVRLLEEHPSDLIAPIINRISQQILSIDPKIQSLIMSEEWEKFQASYKSSLLPALKETSPDDINRAFLQTRTFFKAQSMEKVNKKIMVNGEILKQSVQFIKKFFPEVVHASNNSYHKIVLSNTYLVGLEINRGNFKHLSMDFHNALFRPEIDLFGNNVGQFSLSKESEKSFKIAQQNIERRLQQTERFLTL